jgi:hypothetical protein
VRRRRRPRAAAATAWRTPALNGRQPKVDTLFSEPRRRAIGITLHLLLGCACVAGSSSVMAARKPDGREAWVGLESNPEVMTKYAHSLGVAEGCGRCVRQPQACCSRMLP